MPSALSQTPSRPAVDAAIAELDRRLARVLDALLHHPALQRLEALWRALHRLVVPLHPHDNIRVDILPLRRHELQHDLCARELAHAGLHHHVHDIAARMAHLSQVPAIAAAHPDCVKPEGQP